MLTHDPFFIEKLPTPITERTPRVLTIHVPIYFIFNKNKQLQIIEGKTPYGIKTDKPITRRILKDHKPIVCKPNPITIALKYQKMYQENTRRSMEEVGQQLGVSRVRIHQILNLLKLDQRIIDYIQNINNLRQNNYWTERRLRNIAALPKKEQFDKFETILQDRKVRP